MQDCIISLKVYTLSLKHYDLCEMMLKIKIVPIFSSPVLFFHGFLHPAFFNTCKNRSFLFFFGKVQKGVFNTVFGKSNRLHLEARIILYVHSSLWSAWSWAYDQLNWAWNLSCYLNISNLNFLPFQQTWSCL